MNKILFLFYLLISYFSSTAQSDTVYHKECHLRISLLTCSPGAELYSTFGHSAIRVSDSNDSTDIIFNYGTFDFEDPGFYKKFTLGKLLYFVSIEAFTDFVLLYQYESRGIIEQELNLSCKEKEYLLSALFENAKEENKYYKYDFTYDNCTSRLRDIIANHNRDSLNTRNIRPGKNITFRNLIHEYLNRNNQYWSKLGIDILLGLPLDKKINNSEAMFLPDYLLKAFDSTSVGDSKFVVNKKIILTPVIEPGKRKLFTPLVLFCLLFIMIAGMSLAKKDKFNSFFNFFDIAFFFLCGATGMLILFMWFGTEHQACRNNFNLLWALPSHLPAALLLFKKSEWLKKYFSICFWIYLILIPLWFFLTQQLNVALLPIAGVLCIRSFMLSKSK